MVGRCDSNYHREDDEIRGKYSEPQTHHLVCPKRDYIVEHHRIELGIKLCVALAARWHSIVCSNLNGITLSYKNVITGSNLIDVTLSYGNDINDSHVDSNVDSHILCIADILCVSDINEYTFCIFVIIAFARGAYGIIGEYNVCF